MAQSEAEPDWYARRFPQDAWRTPWRKLKESRREYFWSQHAAMERFEVLPGRRSAVSLPERAPDESDRVILWSQYYALRALATRLDAGIGTERERVAFEAGLVEYQRNWKHVLAQRKALRG